MGRRRFAMRVAMDIFGPRSENAKHHPILSGEHMDRLKFAALSRQCTALLFLLVFGAAPAWSQNTQADSGWRFSVTPYLWLPTMESNLRYGPPAAGGAAPQVTMDADTLLGMLDFAMMFNADARKGPWSVMTDLIYLDLSSDKSGVRSIDFNPGSGPVNIFHTGLDIGTTTKVKGTVWSLAGGYALVQDARNHLDVIGGFRYFDLEATTSWRVSAVVTGPVGSTNFATTGSITQGESLWDAIVGLRGQSKVGSGRWFMPYYVDVGGGDSKLTWQAAGGIGYTYKWGDLRLVYRHLSYEQSGNKLVQDLSFSGPAFGARFQF